MSFDSVKADMKRNAMTPAEKLSQAKPRARKPRNSSKKPPGPLRCRCREIRERLDLSLRDVSNAVGISITGIHALERGNDTQVTTALKLAEFYGVDISRLWTWRK